MPSPNAIVTETGGYVHLSSPWASYHRPAFACPAHGNTARFLEWDERDDRPPCGRCIAEWRRWLKLQTSWITEALEVIETSGIDVWLHGEPEEEVGGGTPTHEGATQ